MNSCRFISYWTYNVWKCSYVDNEIRRCVEHEPGHDDGERRGIVSREMGRRKQDFGGGGSGDGVISFRDTKLIMKLRNVHVADV